MAESTVGHPVELPIALGTVSTNTEEGRRLLQERLAIFAGWVFFLSFGFWCVGAVTGFAEAGVGGDAWSHLLRLPSALHLAASLALGGIWAIATYGRLSTPGLRWLDAGGLVVVGLLFAVMGLAIMREAGQGHVALRAPGDDASGGAQVEAELWLGLFSALLACTNTVIARAIAVPSTPGRTAWISAGALDPTVVVAGYHHLSIGTPVFFAVVLMVNVATWSVVAIAVAWLGSRIIFGLRREASHVRRLGQYALEEKVGEGGMGVVYRASHAMLRRPTAIKLLPPEKAGEENLRRFEREVQLTAQLSHPNTVAIYDYGRTPDGVFYYAMEYLDGITLETLGAHFGPQPVERVVHILRQVCGSLAEAHQLGLIHRDIKPGNIILSERGGEPDVAKVVDFGLVKSLDPGGTELTMAVTSTTTLTGTPMYLPPEAITGQADLDARSDLYALGAVGYFLLTGRPVFEGANLVEVCGHHLHTTPVPPSTRLGRPVPAELEALVLQCLAKAPGERPGSAREMGQILAGVWLPSAWTGERAATWWGEYRASRHPPVPEPAALHRTVQVDVADRVASHH